jgi:serine/threonine protein kinase
MAPEVMRGNYGPMCDMFSIGVIAHVMLSGQMPFGNIDEDEDDKIERLTFRGRLPMKSGRWRKVSDDAKALVRQLLEQNPCKRLSAAEALAHPFLINPPATELRKAQRDLKRMASDAEEQRKEDAATHVRNDSQVGFFLKVKCLVLLFTHSNLLTLTPLLN